MKSVLLLVGETSVVISCALFSCCCAVLLWLYSLLNVVSFVALHSVCSHPDATEAAADTDGSTAAAAATPAT